MNRGIRATTRNGITIEDHPYDRGYWVRYDGEALHKNPESGRDRNQWRLGWNSCNQELMAEESR